MVLGLGAILVLLFASCANPPIKVLEIKPRPKVIRLENTAEISQDGGTVWKKLRIGDELMQGARVRTSKHGQVDIALTNPESLVRVSSSSDVIFELDRIKKSLRRRLI